MSQEKTEMLKARVEPGLVDAVSELRDQNPDLTTSDVVRLLIRKGILATHRENTQQVMVTKPPLPTEHYCLRAETFIESLVDLLARMSAHDPSGAQQLADRITDSWTAATDSLVEARG